MRGLRDYRKYNTGIYAKDFIERFKQFIKIKEDGVIISMWSTAIFESLKEKSKILSLLTKKKNKGKIGDILRINYER